VKRLAACIAAVAALFVLPAAAQTAACPAEGTDYPNFYLEEKLFADAIARAEAIPRPPAFVTGVTVPHHLLAAHLIARGIRLAANGAYDRIVILFPDHFKQTRKPFATTTHGFDTVYGRVPTDAEAAGHLAGSAAEVELSCLFARDHGVLALLPFVRHYLPDVPVLPVAISIRSSRADWEALVAALSPLASERTLILQSTDFSHYLPHHEARQRDQQTLNVLAAGDLDALAALSQPDHMDSVGAMYVQTALQARQHGARATVLASENSQQYVEKFVAETTSYMVVAFSSDLPQAGLTTAPGSNRYFIGGDTFFGRAMTSALLDEAAVDRVAAAVLGITGGAPLILNLEGVLLPDVPAEMEHMVLAMPSDLALDWLRRLNVRAVGLANNHALDIGPSGLAETIAALNEAGIGWFAQGDALDLPGVTLAGLSDHGTNGSQETRLLGPDLLDRLLREDPGVPVVALVHWGREYGIEPEARELELAQEMRRRGTAAIVGAHSHRASTAITQFGGGDVAMIYSLGNFLFDQGSDKASGALAEITVFEQGTLFLRQIPLPNLFDLARGVQQLEPKPGSR
jgi:AmmeMemoRadiSam system protein B